MNKKWRDLYDRIPVERRARIEEKVASDLADMRLAELRRARELTQQRIAGNLNVNQAWVSKIERQTDMYVSTLRHYVEAMGGKLEIVALFEDATVRLNQFEDSAQEPEGSIRYAEVAPPSPANAVGESFVAQDRVWIIPQSSQNSAIGYGELRDRVWQSGAADTTSRPRTPSANTTPKTPKAA